MRPIILLGLSIFLLSAAPKPADSPYITRIYPLGGQAGTAVAVEVLGGSLANTTSVEFDCADLVWEKSTDVSSTRLAGVIAIAPHAAPGAHMLRAVTKDGYSTSAMFNVGQFPSVMESEPDDRPEQAQHIAKLPVEIQGRLDGAADIDQYTVEVSASERWTFNLLSIERGSAVEARMTLLDSAGKRIDFNADRDDFDENPFIEHTFDRAGIYTVKLDQYRGPRGFNFGKNCSYILQISRLPALRSVTGRWGYKLAGLQRCECTERICIAFKRFTSRNRAARNMRA